MVLKYLIQKEFIQIRRNSFLPRLIVMFPIMIMCVMPWVMSMEVRNIVVEVVDLDRSPSSERLVQRIAASDYFRFGGVQPSYAAALADVEQSAADIIVEIPSRYGEAQGEVQIRIVANAVNGVKGSMGVQYLGNIVADHHADEFLAVDEAALMKALKEQVSVLYLYNKHLNYKLFMIPSLMAILVLLLCGFLPALNIVGEKENRTIEAINVTPVGRAQFILAKLIPYWIIAALVMSLCFLLSWLVYGITSAGSLWLVYLLALLFAFVFSGFGLVISNYNDTMQQAVFVMWFFVVNLILLSGLFTPVRSMPEWAYLTTYINPMHYFIDAVRTVFVRGGDFSCIAHQVMALTLFALVMCGWAILSYRKQQ